MEATRRSTRSWKKNLKASITSRVTGKVGSRDGCFRAAVVFVSKSCVPYVHIGAAMHRALTLWISLGRTGEALAPLPGKGEAKRIYLLGKLCLRRRDQQRAHNYVLRADWSCSFSGLSTNTIPLVLRRILPYSGGTIVISQRHPRTLALLALGIDTLAEVTLQHEEARVSLDAARREYLNRLVEASALDKDNQVRKKGWD